MLEAPRKPNHPNIVVAPASIVGKWRKDIVTFINDEHPRFPKVLVYDSKSRSAHTEESLATFDIIIVSMSFVAREQADYEKWLSDHRLYTKSQGNTRRWRILLLVVTCQ